MGSEGRERGREGRSCAQEQDTDERGYPRGFGGKPAGTGELLEFASHVGVTRTVVGKAVAVSGRKSMDGKEKVRRT